MSTRLAAWCEWAGINFKRLCGKKRMAVVNDMLKYYKENRPIQWLKAKYRN